MALGTFKIVSEPPPMREPNTLRMDVATHTAVLTGAEGWKNFWNEFRLDLQSRIAGVSDDRELHKLQGKIEMIDEVEQVFQKITQQKPTSGSFS